MGSLCGDRAADLDGAVSEFYSGGGIRDRRGSGEILPSAALSGSASRDKYEGEGAGQSAYAGEDDLFSGLGVPDHGAMEFCIS